MTRFFSCLLLLGGMTVASVANPPSVTGAEPDPLLEGSLVAGMQASSAGGGPAVFQFSPLLSKVEVCWDPDTASNDCGAQPPNDTERVWNPMAAVGLSPGGPQQIPLSRTPGRPAGSRATGEIKVLATQGIGSFGLILARFLSTQVDVNAPMQPPNVIQGGFGASTRTSLDGDIFWHVPNGAVLQNFFIKWIVKYGVVDADDFASFQIILTLSDCENTVPPGNCNPIMLSAPLSIVPPFAPPPGNPVTVTTLQRDVTCQGGCNLAANRVIKQHTFIRILTKDGDPPAAGAAESGAGPSNSGVSGSFLSPGAVPSLADPALLTLGLLLLATAFLAIRKRQ